jgi:FixJ family two-component response regulator
MPRMRGGDLARELAERDPALPVIFVSGYAADSEQLRGPLIPKPVAADVLLWTIREVLEP